ncbi:MAG: hypothetical protein EA349_14245 [Halomonadaceae bacterium]|nr:MAG: hypothetical protein EA349_14245 [Halomonadaceae bacterium]
MENQATNQKSNSKKTQSRLNAFTFAISIASIGAVVLIFFPWFSPMNSQLQVTEAVSGPAMEAPFFGIPFIYPLLTLYLIASGVAWASKTGHIRITTGKPIIETSLLISVAALFELLFSYHQFGNFHMGYWANFAFAVTFSIWALFLPKKA